AGRVDGDESRSGGHPERAARGAEGSDDELNLPRAIALVLLLLAAPAVVTAQPAGKTYHVGIVSAAAAPGRPTVLWRAFLEALGELGYVEGRNLVVTQAFAAGKREDLPALVADLVKKKVDVLVTTSAPETNAAKR